MKRSKGIRKPVVITGRLGYVKDSTITIDWNGSGLALARLLAAHAGRQDLEITFGPARED